MRDAPKGNRAAASRIGHDGGMPEPAPYVTARRWRFRREIPEAARLDPSNPKWIQICEVGSYVYRGRPAPVTPEIIDEMVMNLRADPAYNPAARSLAGKPPGDVDVAMAVRFGVIALNFDHPSPDGPRPGRGWILDAERRDTGFWALTWFGTVASESDKAAAIPSAYEGMLNGTWKSTSIEWGAKAEDNLGRPIGAYLSGVALTNIPFVTGMTPIQMSRDVGPRRFGAASDVLDGLKDYFELGDDEGLPEVLARIARLKGYALDGVPAPLGVDVGACLEAFRVLLNLPTLADPASIFGELAKLLGALAAEQPSETSMPPETPALPPAQLAREPAVLLSWLRPEIAKLAQRDPSLAIPEDEPTARHVIGMLFKRIGDVADAHKAFTDAAGTTDPKALVELMKKLAELQDLVPELQAHEAAEDQGEASAIDGDVAMAAGAEGKDPVAPENAAYMRYLKYERIGGEKAMGTNFFSRSFDAAGKPIKVKFADRHKQRAETRAAFLAAHGITHGARPAAPQRIDFENAFAGPGARFAASNGEQPDYRGFARPGGEPPPPPAASMTWQKIAALPPSTMDNPGMRLFDALARERYQGKIPNEQARTALHVEAGKILMQLGPAPADLHRYFRTGV